MSEVPIRLSDTHFHSKAQMNPSDLASPTLVNKRTSLRNNKPHASRRRTKITTDALTSAQPAPFLKWAGGKRALLGEIRPRVPSFSGKYVEPFLGAGAVLFDQSPELRKLASDYNPNLVEVYEVIRDNPDELLDALRAHQNTAEHYYSVRAWDRTADFLSRSKVERAARFIYLNKCGYNGLYRVNAKGQMNVPYGSSPNADYIAEANLRAVSAFLGRRDPSGNLLTQIISGDYRLALASAVPGDFVYCDPPYAPISPTSAFVSYTSDGFGKDQQTELRDQLKDLTDKGVLLLLSNSDVPLIRELYDDENYFRIESVSVRRAISATAAGRGKVNEVLVSNYHAVRG